jgi:protein gp37
MMEQRLAKMPHLKKYAGRKFHDVQFHEEELQTLYKTRKPTMFFLNSMSDTLHEHFGEDEILKTLIAIADNQRHTVQVLTKRSQRIELLESVWRNYAGDKLPRNIWLGVTVENADYIDRIAHLRNSSAAVKFISFEPLLSDIPTVDLSGIDWAIVGGESGRKSRAMHPDWVRNILRQCRENNVAFFFKQWGTYAPAPIIGDQVNPGACKKTPIHIAHGHAFEKMRTPRYAVLDGVVVQEYPAYKQ